MEPEVDDDIAISDAALSLADADLLLDTNNKGVTITSSKLGIQPTTSTRTSSLGNNIDNENYINKKKKRKQGLMKPPDAPKRFKSSFIFFSMEKHKEIKDQLALNHDSGKNTNITKMVADAWRNLSPTERETYETMARHDKERYELETANYTPPPGMSLTSKRYRDPGAPKRPMSAYLCFANKRRGEVKAQNPDCSNGEISKILSNMWKETPDDVKKRFKDEENAKWAAYKTGMAEWKKKNDGRKRPSTKDSSALALAKAMKKGKRGKKGKVGDLDDFDDSPTGGMDSDAAFDDHQLGLGGLDSSVNPNPDEMMAASALRGVRGGPPQPGMMVHGDPNQFQHHGNNPGAYGALLGMNGMNPGMNVMNPMLGGAQANAATGVFGQIDMSGFAYNQYGSYPLGGNPQAMLMAQLRGASNPYQQYPGFLSPDQQPNLSQLASLAGTQNNAPQMVQQQQNPMPGINMNMGNGMQGGMGAMMNDNSGGSMNSSMAPF